MNANSSPKRSKTWIRLIRVGVIITLLTTLFLIQSSTISAEYSPWISISSVVPNANVSIALYNFPKNSTFFVQMGKSGTGGIGGYHSAGFTTGIEDYSVKTFEIPVALYDEAIIDVLISGAGVAASSTFYNTGTEGPVPGPVYSPVPTTSIKNVEVGESVTVTTYNFPAEKDFVTYMGEFGTRGIGGIEVGTFYSAGGGSFELTFEIPEELADEHLIAIRLQTPDNHYYAYDWFVNQPAAVVEDEEEGEEETTPDINAGYTGYPLTTIVSSVAKTSVEVKVTNLPKEIDFAVTIGAFGTRGIGGVKVDEFNSGDGGTQTFTFDVPAAYAENHKLAIRLDSGIWYAYDWWVNNPAAVSSTTPTTTTPASSCTGWCKIPSTSFVSLDGSTVTFMAYDFEPNTQWQVFMGAFGTRGVDGVFVQTLTSDADGTFSIMSEIPVSLIGLDKIAIRYEQVDGPYYAYDWFNN
jgi:hypothetical protein